MVASFALVHVRVSGLILFGYSHGLSLLLFVGTGGVRRKIITLQQRRPTNRWTGVNTEVPSPVNDVVSIALVNHGLAGCLPAEVRARL